MTGGAPVEVGGGEGGVGQIQANEGWAAGSMKERLPRRPAPRSVPEGFCSVVLFILSLLQAAGLAPRSRISGRKRSLPADFFLDAVGHAQAEEGAGGGQHGGKAPHGQKRVLPEGFRSWGWDRRRLCGN
ncbi:unnamed protein product [Pylaiella littoralis]